MKYLSLITVLLCAAPALACQDCLSQPHGELFAALHEVESSNRLDPPAGDGGRSIGPMQITQPYWHDAVHRGDRKVHPGKYEDVHDLAYARQVMTWYWQRYQAVNDEQRARMHNGGPRGHLRQATLGYWKKVRRVLEARRNSQQEGV